MPTSFHTMGSVERNAHPVRPPGVKVLHGPAGSSSSTESPRQARNWRFAQQVQAIAGARRTMEEQVRRLLADLVSISFSSHFPIYFGSCPPACGFAAQP